MLDTRYHPLRNVPLSRREMLRSTSTGFGMLALAGLMSDPAYADPATGSDSASPHFSPKVKSVIFCYMSGGLSHIDSFDPKPRLTAEAGQPMPFETARTMFNEDGNIMPSPWDFHRYGEAGTSVSDLFPHIATCVDDIAVIRSMTAKFMEHAQGNFYFHSGQPFTGFPSMGAWVNYGLGSATKDLPGFVVIGSGGIPLGGVNMFSSGFLPAEHQGSFLYPGEKEPLANIQPKEEDANQRRRLDFIRSLDTQFLERTSNHPQIEAAIKNYETAYYMQSAVPELVDIQGETEATRKLYGLDSSFPPKRNYALQCLIARRLIERGVRFVELTMVDGVNRGTSNSSNPWDQHTNLILGHSRNAYSVDQPVAGLLQDLKARGLLDETLVIFAGEFGRTPFVQGTNGRDHNPYGFSMWLAGGGIKGGTVYGATDEYGYHAIEGIRTVHDLHATVLHQLGIDHTKLTYRFGGRDFRLTDVHGNVIHEVLS